MNITPQQNRILRLGAGIIILIYLLLTFFFGNFLSEARHGSLTMHAYQLTLKNLKTVYPPKKQDFTEVKVGTYLENIHNLSIANSSFSADLYVWFSWKGAKELDPGETFQVAGGTIDAKELSSEHHLADGRNYQRYKLRITMNKVFDIRRLSLEDHLIRIFIEDKKHDAATMRYVPDENSAIAPKIHIPGFTVTGFDEVAKPHEYKSTFSSPNAEGLNRVFSEYTLAIAIHRPGFGFYLKIFLPFFLSVVLGLMVLTTTPDMVDLRMGLAGAAFFGVMANTYVISALVPPESGTFGLLDILNIISLFSVILIVAGGLIAHKLEVKNHHNDFIVAFDRMLLYTIGMGYLTLSIVLPLCAYSF
ncbi:MAG: hypothetical protein WA080_07775 [Sulfuricurvum sp.]